jgi:hypothetical protein
MELVRKNHGSGIASVITQQYFSASAPIALSNPQVKFRRVSTILLFKFLNYLSLKLRNWKILRSWRVVYLVHGLEKIVLFFNYPIHCLPQKIVD